MNLKSPHSSINPLKWVRMSERVSKITIKFLDPEITNSSYKTISLLLASLNLRGKV